MEVFGNYTSSVKRMRPFVLRIPKYSAAVLLKMCSADGWSQQVIGSSDLKVTEWMHVKPRFTGHIITLVFREKVTSVLTEAKRK